MSDLSTALIAKALDGLHQRYLYTAQNIANANTPDYRPVRVSFEESLRAAAGAETAIATVKPHVFQEPGDGSTAIRLDLELAAASRTAMRYRALIDLLGRQFALHHAALATGR